MSLYEDWTRFKTITHFVNPLKCIFYVLAYGLALNPTAENGVGELADIIRYVAKKQCILIINWCMAPLGYAYLNLI